MSRFDNDIRITISVLDRLLDYDPAALTSAIVEPDFVPSSFIATPAES